MLREYYGAVGDGDESPEAYEAYQQIQEYKHQGYLVLVEPDHEASTALMRVLMRKAYDDGPFFISERHWKRYAGDIAKQVVDAAYKPEGGS